MTDPPEYPIKLIACGPDGNKPTERVAWTQDFFKELGRYRKPPVDGYDLHFITGMWNRTRIQIDVLTKTDGIG